MSLESTLFIEVVIAHGEDVLAKNLKENQPILFGPYVWHIVDCKFIDEVMTNDVMLSMVRYDKNGKRHIQNMTIGNDVPIRTLWVTQRSRGKVVEEKPDADAPNYESEESVASEPRV